MTIDWGDGETQTVSLMSFGIDPYLSEQSPFHGAVAAIVDSLAKIVAVGGSYTQARLSFQEYFERMGDEPHRWQKPFQALLGAFWTQMAMEIPAIGGKDSMSGTYETHGKDGVLRRDVPPTFVSFCVQTENISNIISQELKSGGNHLVWLHAEYDNNQLPDFEYLKKSFACLTALIHDKQVKSAYALDDGGVAAALTKMVLGSGIGADITGDRWFDAETGSFLLEMTGEPKELLEGLNYTVIGKTLNETEMIVNGTRISLENCLEAWLSTLEPIFPTGRVQVYTKQEKPIIPLYSEPHKNKPGLQLSKPRIFMPIFPGTHGEYETERAFIKAGGKVDSFVIRNRKSDDVTESLMEMEKRMGQSQILMLAGGYSAGDEPDGAGKYMAVLLGKPRAAQAIRDLLDRGGLILGIGNGFQALNRLGLLDGFTLVENSLGRHVSDLIFTKIIADKSPWLWNTKTGDVHLLPVSHRQGRFMANETDMKRLLENNQIAAQYVDFDGNPAMPLRYNPNGSMYAVEAVTNADGQKKKKMGHSERTGDGLYKGIEGNTDQGIFTAGVGYFR
jgi:phosphoribosylformylglycinamidine synthase